MNAEKPKRACARASTDYDILWDGLNWSEVELVVNKLQSRIAKAVERGRYNLVKKLQYLLTNSFYAKLLAVKRVTTNKGKRTPGIDSELWTSSAMKYKAALRLSNKGYKPLPLKRNYIKKSNRKTKRPLGIPTMYDRAMQALSLLSLDPVSETILDPKSFGFRKYRSTKDAGKYLFDILCQKTAPKWVLEGDIKACFDEISHAWLQDNIFMDKEVLKKFLKSGYVYKNQLFKTKSGTVQGGIISPTYANLTLNGLGDLIRKRYWRTATGLIRQTANKHRVHIVIYADDFVVTADNKETLVEIRAMIKEFLAERGLELSKEKTVITHIDEGFDFLGWNFRKYNNKLIVMPSLNSVKKVKATLKETVRVHIGHRQELLIIRLNQIITGWCNYHKHVCAKKAFNDIDHYINQLLRKWTIRRHPNKSFKWRKDRYFVRINNRDWIFKSETNQLKFAASSKIKRHVLIRMTTNPYFPEDREYYLNRRLANS
ncbi:MAG: group II intron reverse transcriptase/maturase [Vallitaleaceae bacterium]|jgi:RNA-directed DNA polymerase|nr:group II intron reverse transcriptase/maturase [Vallitaleaceae bacterium]